MFIITLCHIWDQSFRHMDRRTFFADVVKASNENFENFERNCVCCGLFFKFSYIILNTDYCCGWLNPLETTALLINLSGRS